MLAILSRKKAHISTVLKLSALSLRGSPHFNRFMNSNPGQVTSFGYLGTNVAFVLDGVLTVALPKARHSLVLCQDFTWLWQGPGYTNLKHSQPWARLQPMRWALGTQFAHLFMHWNGLKAAQ